MQRRISLSKRSFPLFCFLVVFAVQSLLAAAPVARITVDAGDSARMDTPVSAVLEGVACPCCGGEPLKLVEIKNGRKIAVSSQVECGENPTLWWILSGKTAAGEKRVFELMNGESEAKSSDIQISKDDKALVIKAGDGKVLQYNHAIVPPPEGKSKLYERSGFIHPMWAPKGKVLTNIHPPDHIHHMGIWMPWTHTQFKGKRVDFWNLNGGGGTVRFVKYLSKVSGPVYGGFKAEQEHVVLNTDDGETVVLKEIWDVRVYNVGGQDDGYWLWDFKSTQRCVADTKLHQEQYRYGGFGWRGPGDWDEENAMYLTSEGKNRKNGHGTRAKWCEVAGEVDDKWQGALVMGHPENFQFPEPMRIWPSGQVFFNFCPSQATAWDMLPGVDHVFRYRLHLHEGKLDKAEADRIWNDFGAPPEVSVNVLEPVKRIVLFDGRDTSRWQHTNGNPVKWDVKDGVMTIKPHVKGGGSIQTKENFSDFRMHIEFNMPKLPDNVRGQGRGNSGVYIQKRYEVQILDSYGQEPQANHCAGIYKRKKPDVNACKKPGEWQSYDIVFHAARYDGDQKVKNARITVLHNGIRVHDNYEIPGKTGAGKPEGPEPGPILLQDHGNPVSFRNIWIQPL